MCRMYLRICFGRKVEGLHSQSKVCTVLENKNMQIAAAEAASTICLGNKIEHFRKMFAGGRE